MELYYHPILGLQYYYNEPMFLVNLDEIPVNYSYEEFLELWRTTGIQMIDSSIEPAITIFNPIRSNF